LLATITVLDRDRIKARDIKNDEILGTSERARTRPLRVANLIAKSEVLESVLVEKLPIPPLINNVM
jgi:hypothetical protein